uniref:Peptidase A2 domain-containing protein n=1 Tax=Strongyloides venezuelensis TaxID=75913 RepID=A0A0K0FFN4_STRVS
MIKDIQNQPRYDDSSTIKNLQAIMTDLEVVSNQIKTNDEHMIKKLRTIENNLNQPSKIDASAKETQSVIQSKLNEIVKTIKSLTINSSNGDLETIKAVLKEITKLTKSDTHIKKSEWEKILHFVNEITNFETPEDGIPASVASIMSIIVAGIAKSRINKVMTAKTTNKEVVKNDYKIINETNKPITRRKEGLFSTRIALIHNSQQNNSAINIEVDNKTVLTLIDTGANTSIIAKDLYETLSNDQKKKIQQTKNDMLTVTNEKLNTLRKTYIKILDYWIECHVTEEDIPYRLIIGTNAIQQFGELSINYKTNTVKFDDLTFFRA